MATVSGTFTAVGQSAVLDVPAVDEEITASLTGTWVATVRLEREIAPHSNTWEVIRSDTGNYSIVIQQIRKNERYRFNTTAFTSGTVTFSVADGDLAVDASSVITTTQAGADIAGTLSVSGASTLTGAVASGALTSTGAIADGAASTFTTGATVGTMTLADGSITDSSGAISFGNETLATTGISTAAGNQTTLNIGAVPGTVTAVEWGDGFHHVTRLTVTAAVFVVDVPANVEEVGALIYTFPSGVHRVNSTHMDITAIALETNDPADCILACGSTLAAGDTVTFGAATDEDFIDGVAFDVTDLNGGTPTVVAEVGDGTIFLTGGSKLFHINTAGTWTDAVAAGEATVTGTVTIDWTFLGT